MKKTTRDKKFGLARETIRELTSPEDKAALARVVGGSCAPMAPSTHCTALCIDDAEA
ncbi:MAG TPA: hypothetical protein VF516_14900 [Kofleriaceae bacterium]